MTARERSRIQTRERVVRAARELFLAQGFSGTTVRDIADRAGVSVGSVMVVGDKNALLVEVFDTLIAAEHDAVAVPTGETPARRALDLVRPFIRIFTTHSDLSRTYAATLVSGGHAAGVFAELARRLIDEFVAAGATPGQARAMHAAYLGVLFIGAGRGADHKALERELTTVFDAIGGA